MITKIGICAGSQSIERRLLPPTKSAKPVLSITICHRVFQYYCLSKIYTDPHLDRAKQDLYKKEVLQNVGPAKHERLWLGLQTLSKNAMYPSRKRIR